MDNINEVLKIKNHRYLASGFAERNPTSNNFFGRQFSTTNRELSVCSITDLPKNWSRKFSLVD